MHWRRPGLLAGLGVVFVGVAGASGPLPNVRDSLLTLVGLTYLAAAIITRFADDRSGTYRLTAAAFPALLVVSYAEFRLALHLAFDAVPGLGFNALRLVAGVLLVFPVVLGVAWARVPGEHRWQLAVAFLSVLAGALVSVVALPIAWFPAPVQVVGVGLVAAVADAVAVVPVVLLARSR